MLFNFEDTFFKFLIFIANWCWIVYFIVYIFGDWVCTQQFWASLSGLWTYGLKTKVYWVSTHKSKQNIIWQSVFIWTEQFKQWKSAIYKAYDNILKVRNILLLDHGLAVDLCLTATVLVVWNKTRLAESHEIWWSCLFKTVWPASF